MNKKKENFILNFLKETWQYLLIILIIILIVFGFYIYKFHYGLSNEQSDWGYLGDYFGGIIATIFSSFSFLLVIYTIKKQQEESIKLENRFKQELNNKNIFEFLKEYRSDEMGKKIIILKNFYKKYKCDKKKYKDAYLKECKKGSKIHFARRSLSHFYDQITILLRHGNINEELVFTMWSEKIIEDAHNMLVPCEEAMQENQGDKPYVELLPELLCKAKEFNKKKINK